MKQHVLQLRNTLFVPLNFETRVTTDATQSSNSIGRVINAMNTTFNNNRSTIPKWIVMVIEDDVLSSVEYTNFGVSGAYGLIIDHILKEIDASIKFFTANLPHKANKYGRPYVLWIEPSLHTRYENNQLRIKFVRCLHAAIKAKNRHLTLPLRQFWSENDSNLVFNTGSLTRQGLSTFTKAVDATIRFADTKLMRNYGTHFTQVFSKDKLCNEAETRITEFEKKVAQEKATKATMLRQQQMRQQFVHIRNFFENRVNNIQHRQPRQDRRTFTRHVRDERRHSPNRRNHRKPAGCRKELFKNK